jgi:hypothetical protein
MRAVQAEQQQTHLAAQLLREADDPAPARKGGRPRSAVGQQILDALAQHPEGLTAEALRVAINAQKALGDTLAGMRRLGTVRAEKEGRGWRYYAVPEARK